MSPVELSSFSDKPVISLNNYLKEIPSGEEKYVDLFYKCINLPLNNLADVLEYVKLVSEINLANAANSSLSLIHFADISKNIKKASFYVEANTLGEYFI